MTEPAQTTLEYALLVAAVALLVLLGGYFFGAQIQAWLQGLLRTITSSTT